MIIELLENLWNWILLSQFLRKWVMADHTANSKEYVALLFKRLPVMQGKH